MIRSFFKLAVRRITKNVAYSVINMLGLTIGFTACMLVAAVVWNGWSYDRQWSHSHELYRVMMSGRDGKVIDHDFNTLTGIGPSLKSNFPAVTEFCRLRNTHMNLLSDKSSAGVMADCLTGDFSVFKMLDIHILEGRPEQAVDGYPNLIISRELKEKLFPDLDPIGKIVTRTSEYAMPYEGKKKQYLVTGVMENLPANSLFFAGALLLDAPWPGENDLNPLSQTVLPQYILVRPGTDMVSFTTRVNNWYANSPGKDNNSPSALFFQPITSIHLHPEIGNDPDTSESLRNISIYIAIAALIMLIASINYINLSLAISLQKIRHIGIRVVLGAGRSQIYLHSLAESAVFFFISFASASLIFILCLGPVQSFIGHSIDLSTKQYLLLFFFSAFLLLTIITSSGFYPTWVLSRLNPALILRGTLGRLVNADGIRKALIVVQFIISITLFIFIIIITRQLDFLNHKDLGFDKDNLLCIDYNVWGSKARAFKQELTKLAGVTNVSISSWNPALGEGYMSTDMNDTKDSSKKVKIWYIGGDYDLVSTLKFRLIDGNSLRDRQPDTAKANSDPVLITAYTAKALNVKNLGEPNPLLQGEPVGILKDFNNGSLRYTMTPTVVTVTPSPSRGYILVRTSGPANRQLPVRLKRLWQQFYPDKLLQFSWTSESLAVQYMEESKLQKCFSILGLLSVFLACLGLFGLVSFSIELRVKEIGIRKALGATATRIILLLSATYLKLIFLAIIIATPAALWIGSSWLQGYAYRIELTWGVVIISWLSIFSLALFTLVTTVARVALQQPIIALKTE
ncbi:MAG TPA: FtsX-like permease family protein [Puia sp.]|jgi:putative ABC transport system permease protein|nr:FtsX-like permease family protein [Puia sp.]